MHCDELLFTTTRQSSSTGRPIFPLTNTMTDCDWPIRSQIQTTSLVSRMFGMHKCEYSKSNHLIVHTFGCKYLGFHTIYGLETLGIPMYSPSLLTCKVLGKSEMWPSNMLNIK